MSHKTRPLPEIPSEAYDSLSEDDTPTIANPTGLLTHTVPTKHTTFVRALVDIDPLEHEASIPEGENLLPNIKTGDIIEVRFRISANYWKGVRGKDWGVFPLNEQFAPIVTGKVLAIWNRRSDNTEELDFDYRDEIYLLYKLSNWWYWGEVSGRVGLVPFNFVESIPPNGYLKNVNPAALETDMSPPKEWTNETITPLKVRAVWSWDGTEQRDLTLKEDDSIDVLSRFHKDWWFGRINDRVGIFPSCYVSEEFDKLVGPKRPLQRPPWHPYYVIALYTTRVVEKASYELELTAGLLITVEYMCSDRWWKGRTRDGREGWFPDNYVRPVIDRRENFLPGFDWERSDSS